MASRLVQFQPVKVRPVARRPPARQLAWPHAEYWAASGIPVPVGSRRASATVRPVGRDPYPAKRYPLVKPILETVRSRLMKGACSACGTRLRIQVTPGSTVAIRCPVCGHEGRVHG